MRDSWKTFIASFCLMSFFSVGCGKPESGGTVRVALTRDDNIPGSYGKTFIFDENEIAKELEKNPTKFPEPLPEGGRRVMFYQGGVLGVLRKVPGKAHVLLTLDVNANRDLSDDAPIEVPKTENWKEGVVVKVARHFTSPEPHTEWLPYLISIRESSGPDGQARDSISVRPNYEYKGDFRLGDKDW
ncbi:MAG: hypothetical protein OEW05_09915, partial [Candidatus Aminicenantes bacterium]|nr:hypothetical protein [Candidatus Aminicenantes bacterium]